MRKKQNKKNISIIILVFFVLFSICYYSLVALPVIKTYSMIEVKAIIEKTVNLAVSNVINRTLSYDSLIDIHYTNNGEILSFSANQYEINSITREIVKESQYQLSNLGDGALQLNIGTMSGVPFFIGRGPKVHLKLLPIGAVTGDFSSEFTSVGINMTKHALFLQIKTHACIVLPIKSFDVYSTNQVLLAESIIVGKVPEVYINGANLGNSLNLVP